jgi:hypothetical protein
VRFFIGLLLMFFTLAGCAADVKERASTSPAFDLPSYFNAPVVAHGMVQDRRGKVRRLFTATIEGRWENTEKGTLYEEFLFDDGEKQTRTWILTRTSANTWKGTAEDVIGVATGEQFGNAMRWTYQMDVKTKGRTWRLTFDDWLYLQNETLLLNKATMSKYGVPVGELTLVMEKRQGHAR